MNRHWLFFPKRLRFCRLAETGWSNLLADLAARSYKLWGFPIPVLFDFRWQSILHQLENLGGGRRPHQSRMR